MAKTWETFVAQILIKKDKSKCCGIKVNKTIMKNLFLLLLILLPITVMAQSYAKSYGGEKDSKGRPNGEGIMYFGPYNEKLEGIFEKGVPVSGKGYRYSSDGRLIMKFEGTFKPLRKGLWNQLNDLIEEGEIVYYMYESDKGFKDNGYQVMWGHITQSGRYKSTEITAGYLLATKKKKMRHFVNGRYDGEWTEMNSDAQQYVNDIGHAYIDSYYKRAKNESDMSLNNMKVGKATMFGPIEPGLSEYTVSWSGNVVDGMIDGNGYGVAFKDLCIWSDDQVFYFTGTFKRGYPTSTFSYKIPDKVYTKQFEIYEGSIENTPKDYQTFCITGKTLPNRFTTGGLIGTSRGIILERNGKPIAHELTSIPVLKDSPHAERTVQSISPFSNGYATVALLVKFSSYDNPFLLEYKIDENGRYCGLMPQNTERFMCYMDTIKMEKDILLKAFNSKDLNTLGNSLRGYGYNRDKFLKTRLTYMDLCKYLLPYLGQDYKTKAEEFQKTTDNIIRKIDTVYEHIDQDYNWMYGSWSLKMLADYYQSQANIYELACKDVDNLLQMSVINNDAAQTAKACLQKNFDNFKVIYDDVWPQILAAADAEYEEKRLECNEIDITRSKAPSKVRYLLGGSMTYDIYGVIFFKDQKSVQYNIFRDISGKEKYCIVGYLYEFYKNLKSYEFDSYEEMVTTLIQSRSK